MLVWYGSQGYMVAARSSQRALAGPSCYAASLMCDWLLLYVIKEDAGLTLATQADICCLPRNRSASRPAGTRATGVAGWSLHSRWRPRPGHCRSAATVERPTPISLGSFDPDRAGESRSWTYRRWRCVWPLTWL